MFDDRVPIVTISRTGRGWWIDYSHGTAMEIIGPYRWRWVAQMVVWWRKHRRPTKGWIA